MFIGIHAPDEYLLNQYLTMILRASSRPFHHAHGLQAPSTGERVSVSLLMPITTLFALAVLAFAPMAAHAQGGAQVSAGVSAAVQRARVHADAGEDDKARRILDSLVTTLPRESNDAAEALHWRALMSDDAAVSERDWKRIVVESPFSPHASNALYRLAELNARRGNYAMTRQNVQQLMTDHPDAPERSRAMLVLAQSYFDDRDAPRACGVITAVRKEAPLSAVEVRLQADEMQQQCRNVREVAIGGMPDTSKAVVATPANTTRPTLATQTATLPAATPPATVPPAAKPPETRPPAAAPATSGMTPMDSMALAKAARDSTTRANALRRDSVTRANTARRDSITRAAVAAKNDSLNAVALARAERDSIARAAATSRQDSLRAIATARADSIRRVVARDSVLRDSLLKVYAARDSAAGIISPRERARRDSVARAANAPTTPAARPARARFSIQVAAYDTRAQANALVKKLGGRNLDAHIAGTRKPYRVQVGRYATRAEATEALAALKKKGQKGFVVEVPPS